MTPIAGVVLPDGVMVAADARATWQGPVDLHTDNVQKFVKIGRSNSLGFSGNIRTVNYLLPHIFAQLPRPGRPDQSQSVVAAIPPRELRCIRAAVS